MDLFAVAESHGLQRIALSRASWFRDTVHGDGAVEVPVIGGRTVWESIAHLSGLLHVVEEPNYFGCYEADPPETVVVERVMHLSAQKGPLAPVRDAQHLAASLAQIPGLKVPHGQPESCWFVVSLPGSAENAARALQEDGFSSCTSLGRDFPEFPGGLRIQVAWPQQENSRFCATVRLAM